MTKTLSLIAVAALALSVSTRAATVGVTADGSDGFDVFSSVGGSGPFYGSFTGASDIGDPAWGFWAYFGSVSEALYDITGGALTVGQTINFDMDNGSVDNLGTVGWGLQNIGTTSNRIEVYFVGGATNYTLADASGTNDTGIPFTSSGLNLSFTLTGTDTYSLDITPIGSSTSNFTGTLAGTAGTGVDRLRFFNANAGQGSDHDAFFNNISVVPEPGSLVMFLSGAALVLCRRRRS
jgi:hypothetical protein